MTAEPTIIKWPNCATKNRVRPTAQGVPCCSVCHAPLPWIVETDADSFEDEITASPPVLVDFWAPWCGPCRMVTPVVEEMGRQYAGRLKVVKLDIDQAPAIATRFSVQGIPLLVLIRDGQQIDRVVGAVPPAALHELLERHIGAAGPGG